MSRSALLSAALLLLLVAASAVSTAQRPTDAASSADCTAVGENFPYAQTATECIVTNMCYTRTLCCPAPTTTDLNLCLDITTFDCNLTSVCASHVDDASWYPFTLNNGLSVSCCRDGYVTTPAPSVPNFDVSESSNADDSSNEGPLPARTCDEDASEGCAATNMFPSLIRAFCQDAIPTSYTDQYLVQSASRMCCEYAAAPAGTDQYNSVVGQGKCGFDLLDFPRVGEFHCSMAGRAATICCNGRITGTAAAASSGSASGATTVVGDNYTYISNTCLYVPETGSVAVAPGIAVSVVMVSFAVTMLLVL